MYVFSVFFLVYILSVRRRILSRLQDLNYFFKIWLRFLTFSFFSSFFFFFLEWQYVGISFFFLSFSLFFSCCSLFSRLWVGLLPIMQINVIIYATFSLFLSLSLSLSLSLTAWLSRVCTQETDRSLADSGRQTRRQVQLHSRLHARCSINSRLTRERRYPFTRSLIKLNLNLFICSQRTHPHPPAACLPYSDA